MLLCFFYGDVVFIIYDDVSMFLYILSVFPSGLHFRRAAIMMLILVSVLFRLIVNLNMYGI
jgi:hypothetical protein